MNTITITRMGNQDLPKMITREQALSRLDGKTLDQPIKITTHTGKMTGTPSISTSVKLNQRCQERAKCDGICAHCYAAGLLDKRDGLRKNLELNTELLTKELIYWDDLPRIYDDIFRFEAFGDLNNEIQLVNYVRICLKNPKFPHADKVFTVYTLDYALENNVPINCCYRKCFECRRCYTDNNVTEIFELLKSDQRKKKAKELFKGEEA